MPGFVLGGDMMNSGGGSFVWWCFLICLGAFMSIIWAFYINQAAPFILKMRSQAWKEDVTFPQSHCGFGGKGKIEPSSLTLGPRLLNS